MTAGAIDTLALEANRVAGRGFDRYVRFGEGDPVALIRSPSFFRIWKGDEFGGLLIWLRAWNLANPDRPVRVIGIDNQDAGTDAGAALAFLGKRECRARDNPPGAVRHADDRCGRADGQSLAMDPDLEAGRAAGGDGRGGDVARHAGGEARGLGERPDYADALHAATVAWQNLHQFEREVGIVDLATLPPDYGRAATATWRRT
ncbi:erythromycin esterase family protein [Sphingomonas sp. MMS24-JH45]